VVAYLLQRLGQNICRAMRHALLQLDGRYGKRFGAIPHFP